MQGADINRKALALINDPRFLFLAMQRVGELGVVGEERNRLVILLACITRNLRRPVSVLLKGPTSSGKTEMVRAVTQLFPPSMVVERSGLSGKALAYGKTPLAKKILYINEYRCGRDAQQLLRLLQSGEPIKHEATTVRGSHRGTTTVQRTGTPVVLTTTTDEEVFEDDETRFLSIWADESPDQTRAILVSKASAPSKYDRDDLAVWQKAMALLKPRHGDFMRPPRWLQFVAKHIPCDTVRVRRDWGRFLVFCEAAALCRHSRLGPDESLNISFSDYCVAYKIFEPVFASTVRGLHSRVLELGSCVAKLNLRHSRAVSAEEVAAELGWKRTLVYKYVKPALRHRLIHYEQCGARETNLKRFTARGKANHAFLPRPRVVFDRNPEIGNQVRYVDPFTGKFIVMKRKSTKD